MTKAKLSTKKKFLFVSDEGLTLTKMRELLSEYSLINASYPEVIEMDTLTFQRYNSLFPDHSSIVGFHGIPVRENKL